MKARGLREALERGRGSGGWGRTRTGQQREGWKRGPGRPAGHTPRRSKCLLMSTRVPSAVDTTPPGLGLSTAGLGPDPRLSWKVQLNMGAAMLSLLFFSNLGERESKSHGQPDRVSPQFLSHLARGAPLSLPQSSSTPGGPQRAVRPRNFTDCGEDSCTRVRASTHRHHDAIAHVKRQAGLLAVRRTPCPPQTHVRGSPAPARRAPTRAHAGLLARALTRSHRRRRALGAPLLLGAGKRGRREGQETLAPFAALQSPQRRDPDQPSRGRAAACPLGAGSPEPRGDPLQHRGQSQTHGRAPRPSLGHPLPSLRRPGTEAPAEDVAPHARGTGCTQDGRGAPLGMRRGPRVGAARSQGAARSP